MSFLPSQKTASFPDKTIEVVCLIILIGLWLVTIMAFVVTPFQVPTHFNAAGIADSFGSRTTLFFIPFIATGVYILLTLLSKHHRVSVYHELTEDKTREKLNGESGRLLRVLKLIVVLLLTLTNILTITTAHHLTRGLGNWFLPVMIILIMSPTIYFFIRASVISKEKKP